MDNTTNSVQTMAEMTQNGVSPEVLFWVGCAGSFDDRSKKITKAFVELLQKANVSFAVLGPEESCTGIRQNVQEMSFCFKCKRPQT